MKSRKSTSVIDAAASTCWLLGLPVDRLSLDEAQAYVTEAALERQSLVFATPNLNFLRTASRDQMFHETLMKVGLSLADGMPLIWLMRLFAIRLERVAGSDLFQHLAAAEPRRKLRVFFFGGPVGAAEAAAAKINRSAKGLYAVGALNPGFGTIEEMSTSEVIDRINASQADLLVVSLGSRKGHQWIERNRPLLSVPVISHLGAVVNFTAGNTTRAPVRLQRLGLEWLWRILQEPNLVSRYTADARFLLKEIVVAILPLLLWRLMTCLWKKRRTLTVTYPQGRDDVLLLTGSLVRDQLPILAEAYSRRHRTVKIIDLDGVDDVDCCAIGYLYKLRYRSCAAESVSMIGGGEHLRRLFRLHRAEVLIASSSCAVAHGGLKATRSGGSD